jgi:Na+/H+ antiporter NhaD/arsenite permease-like protein
MESTPLLRNKVGEVHEIDMPTIVPLGFNKPGTPRNSPRRSIASHDIIDEPVVQETSPRLDTTRKPKSLWEKIKLIFKHVKIGTIIFLFLAVCVVFGTQHEPQVPEFYSLTSASNITVDIDYRDQSKFLQVFLSSPMERQMKSMTQGIELDLLTINMFLDLKIENTTIYFPIVNASMPLFQINTTHEDGIIESNFLLPYGDVRGDCRLILSTPSNAPIPVMVTLKQQTWLIEYTVPMAYIIFTGVYSLIIFDVVSRPLAGLIGVFVGIMGLSLVQQRPTIREMAGFVDWGALALVFGMMLIFGILKGSGVFEWAALKAYKLARGKIWALMIIMSFFCFFVSVFIDNVTLMLLMVPITFQICQVIDIDPLPLLITECLFGNVGGAGAPLSEEFVIILNNPGIQKYNISFAKSLAVLFPGAFLGALACFLPVWISNRSIMNKKPVLNPEKAKIIEQVRIWKKSLGRYDEDDPEATPEELKVKQILLDHIKSLEDNANSISDSGGANLDDLEKQYRIHNKPLLIRSSIIIAIVMFLFVIESFIHPWIHLSLPWIALMGAVALLLFSGIEDIDHVFQETIEWPTMIFFVTLFILIECVNRMGMMASIGSGLEKLIHLVPEQWKMFFAITLLIWVSAFVSAFVDNVPYITGMIPVLLQLAKPPTGLPIEGILYSLFFGVVIGGSGTLIGCAGNVLVADMSKKRGLPITFWSFLKISAPFTFVCVFVVWIYLVILYAVIGI